MVVLHAELDPLTGAKARATQFGEADRLWRAEHGDEDTSCRARTSPQRLADALATIIDRRPRTGPVTETAEVLVAISYRDLISDHPGDADVLGVGPIPAATARRLACDTGIIPLVLGGRSDVLDLGRSRRLANRAQRRALRHRHPTCGVEDCTVAYDHCQIHHLNPWKTGGTTDLDHLTPICNRHHHLVHEGGWTLQRLPNGTFALVPPQPSGGVNGRGTGASCLPTPPRQLTEPPAPGHPRLRDRRADPPAGIGRPER